MQDRYEVLVAGGEQRGEELATLLQGRLRRGEQLAHALQGRRVAEGHRQRTDPRPDPHREEIVGGGLGDLREVGISPDLTGVEPVRMSGVGEELPGLR